MGSSPYFRNYDSSPEQALIESLVHEALRMYACDMYYIKRTQLNPDTVIADDKLSRFSAAFPVGCYIKTVDGFTGDGQFLSKFGVEIRDQVILALSKREFKFEVINNDPSFTRPREGDLIYMPITKKLFEITFVDYKPVMYQFGSLQSYDMTCEVFAYNNEEFNTGFQEIDQLFERYVVPGNGNSPNMIMAEGGALDNFGRPTETDVVLEGEDGTLITWGDGDPESNDPGSEITDIGWEGQKYIDYTDQNPLTNGKF